MAKRLPMHIINPGCKLKVIEESTGQWKIVATCFDTPKSIRGAMECLKLENVWVFDCLGDKRYVSINDL